MMMRSAHLFIYLLVYSDVVYLFFSIDITARYKMFTIIEFYLRTRNEIKSTIE